MVSYVLLSCDLVGVNILSLNPQEHEVGFKMSTGCYYWDIGEDDFKLLWLNSPE